MYLVLSEDEKDEKPQDDIKMENPSQQYMVILNIERSWYIVGTQKLLHYPDMIW